MLPFYQVRYGRRHHFYEGKQLRCIELMAIQGIPANKETDGPLLQRGYFFRERMPLCQQQVPGMAMHYHFYGYTCFAFVGIIKKIIELPEHRQLGMLLTGCDLKNYLHADKPN